MKIYENLWYCLPEFALEREICETKVVEETKTHILGSVFVFSHKDSAFYDVMWKCMVKPDRSQMTI